MERQNAPERVQSMVNELYLSSKWRFWRDIEHEGDGEDRETITETHDEWQDALESLGFIFIALQTTTPDTTLQQAVYWVNRGLGTPLNDPRGKDPGGTRHLIIAPQETLLKALTVGLPKPTPNAARR